MRIKEKENQKSKITTGVKSLSKGIDPVRGVLILMGIGVVLLFILGVMFYGAFLTKLEYDTYSKPNLIRVSELDFSFISPFKSADLIIDSKHLTSMEEIRKEVIRQGSFDAGIKKIEFPGILNYDGIQEEVKISLLQPTLVNMDDPSKWSFQIRVRGQKYIDGMKLMQLLNPSATNYMPDWLAHELYNKRDIQGLKRDFVEFSINGQSTGLYYMKELMHERLTKSPRFENGLLVRVGENLTVFNEDKIKDIARSNSLIIQLRQKWISLQNGTIGPEELINVSAVGRFFAIADIINNQDPLIWDKMIFYYNPENELLEPVVGNSMNLRTSNLEKFSSILDNAGKATKWQLALDQNPILREIIKTESFNSSYLLEAESISPTDSMDTFFTNLDNEYRPVVNTLYKDYPEKELGPIALNGFAKKMRYLLFPDFPEMLAWHEHSNNSSITVKLTNQQKLPLEVFYLNWRDSIYIYPESRVVLEKQKQPKIEEYKFIVPESSVLTDSMISDLTVVYNVLNLESPRRSINLFPWNYDQRMEMAMNPASRTSNFKEFEFVTHEAETATITFPSGNWTLDRDLIIPKQHQVIFEPGCSVDLTNHAHIISYSPFFMKGTSVNPVRVFSSDKTGEGIILLNTKERSKIEFTEFLDLSCPVDKGWALTGAVTFYESPVDISNTSFDTNIKGDDFLNIIRSDFTLDRAHFINILSDAFDSDYSMGVVSNSTFVKSIEQPGSKMT